MRAISCLIAVALVAVVSAASRTGSLSGDPHFTTFDGVFHDFQGVGNWVIMKHTNQLIEAQARFFKCAGASSPVTCIQDVTVSLSVDGRSFATVSWGIVGTPGKCYVKDSTDTTSTEYSMVGTTGTLWPAAGVSILGGAYLITYNTASRQLRIVSNAALRLPAVSVTIGQYLFSATIPVEYVNNINGLLGFYDGNANNEFIAPDGTNVFSAIKTLAGSRYNPPALYTWGAQWAVSASGPNFPLVTAHEVKTMNADGTYETRIITMADVPAAVPTPTEQTDINTLKFTDLTAVAQIQTNCRDQFPDDAEGLNNCMYDLAVIPTDASVSASNAVAAKVAAADGSSGSSSTMDRSTALAVGLTLGLVALAAIIAGLVLYVRLNRVKKAHSQALILLQERGGAPESGDIRLSENI